MVGFDDIGRVVEEPAQHLPQARRGDATWLIEMAEYRRIRCPSGRRGRQTALRQIPVQYEARERRQDHLAEFRPLAGEMKPACAVLDAAERHANQFGRPQAGRATEVEHKTQALCSR
jgi:hypothetical protein